MTSMKDFIDGKATEGFINLKISLDSNDLDAAKLLDSIPTITGNQEVTMGEAEQLLLNAIWWIRTLGSTGKQEASKHD